MPLLLFQQTHKHTHKQPCSAQMSEHQIQCCITVKTLGTYSLWHFKEKGFPSEKKMPFFNSWNKSDELPPTKPEQPLLPPIPSGGGWSEEEKYLNSGVTSETQPSCYLGIMYLWIFSLTIFPSTGEKKNPLILNYLFFGSLNKSVMHVLTRLKPSSFWSRLFHSWGS